MFLLFCLHYLVFQCFPKENITFATHLIFWALLKWLNNLIFSTLPFSNLNYYREMSDYDILLQFLIQQSEEISGAPD